MLKENIELKNFTTFKIGGNAKYFFVLENENQLTEMYEKFLEKSLPVFVLGGGSNIIVSDKNLNVFVIKNEIKGIETLEEDKDGVSLSVGAGEVWDDFVSFTVNKNYSGIEMLSWIPGTVGASPVQNIGAYGGELSNVFVSAEVFDLKDGIVKTFKKNDCDFSYRDSIFKKNPGRYLILRVLFKLNKKDTVSIPDYPGVLEKIKEKDIKEPNLLDIRETIISIRNFKLPDPKIIPNVGSFFKNPVVDKVSFEKLKLEFPNIKSFSVDEKNVKVPAGWLIETAGLKGKSFGPISIYENNALVLVNNKGAKSEDVLRVKVLMQERVFKIFKISLESEPVFIGL